MSNQPQPSWEWLRKVEGVGKQLEARTKWEAKEWLKSPNGMNTTRRVYTVLLYDPERTDPFGIYVGMTHYTPPQRFKHHKAGIRANALVRNFGIQLLPFLYRHLNSMIPAEAEWMEHQLFLKLRSEIGWVSMGR